MKTIFVIYTFYPIFSSSGVLNVGSNRGNVQNMERGNEKTNEGRELRAKQ